MGRRSDHSPAELKGLLLDRATAIIAADGVAALTARRLATQTGYSVGTVYNVFAHLDDLIVQVNARTLAHLHHHLTAAQPRAPDAPPDARLHALAAAYVAFTTRSRHLWNALFDHRPTREVALPPGYAAQIVALFALIEAPLTEILGPGHEAARARAARALWAGLHGLCSLSQTDKLALISPDSLDVLVASFLDDYLAGLRVRAATAPDPPTPAPPRRGSKSPQF